MNQDNQWHDGILYQHSDDGCFVLADNFDEGDKDDRPKTIEGGGVKYQEVKYNWNHGEPIVDCGDFKAALVDLSVFMK